MSEQIPGDGRTFAHHLFTLNSKQLFHHDIPKALGKEQEEMKAIQASWERLPPEIQKGLLNASGIIDAIAHDLDAAPKDVIDSIVAKYGITVEDAQKYLAEAQETVTGVAAATNQDLYTTIENYQDYFKKYHSKVLSAILSGAAQLVGLAISPGATVADIVMNIETAYQIIKGLFKK